MLFRRAVTDFTPSRKRSRTDSNTAHDFQRPLKGGFFFLVLPRDQNCLFSSGWKTLFRVRSEKWLTMPDAHQGRMKTFAPRVLAEAARFSQREKSEFDRKFLRKEGTKRAIAIVSSQNKVNNGGGAIWFISSTAAASGCPNSNNLLRSLLADRRH